MAAPDPYVIWSFEHDGYWRPGGYGYTPDLVCAGSYSRDEAIRIVTRANVVAIEEILLPLRLARLWEQCVEAWLQAEGA